MTRARAPEEGGEGACVRVGCLKNEEVNYADE